MQRVAFQLRLRAGTGEAYDQAHKEVWPELLAELTAAGAREYSIFRRGQELFLYLRVPDAETFFTHMEHIDANRRWQQSMAPLFEPVPSLRPGERYAMMQEVFYMPGVANGRDEPALQRLPKGSDAE